jgi:hypothetical protein
LRLGLAKGGAGVEYDLELLRAEQHVSTEAVDSILDNIWHHLSDDQSVRELIGETENPFRAQRRESQFGFAETIAIAVVGGLGKDIASTLWKEYVWPALKAQFGADLKEAEAKKPQDDLSG